MSKVFVIPDTQVKEGVNTDHLEAAGNYIVDHKPDTIIHLGDHWDMPSLSEYDRGKKGYEHRRYTMDIEAGKAGMERILQPINKYNNRCKKRKEKTYRPKMIFLLGNHEQRIDRLVQVEPRLEGAVGYDHFELDKYGWTTIPFLTMYEQDGVYYSHYFYNPMSGKPYGGRASTRLSNIGFSFTMGHQQGKDIAEKHLANGQTLRGLVAGSFYSHDEEYKGPQGNTHWRGCIYKTEVKDGNYCLVELSLDYLTRRWL